MDNEDVIREQMEDTRTSLTEKLESLEKQVSTTVQGATTNVAETVEAVKDTVAAVKDTVQDTVASVKESVEETISTVKDTVHEGWSAVKGMLDVPGLVESYPWAMFGGSVALGFILEGLLVKPARPGGTVMGTPGPALPPDHYSGEAFVAAKRPAPSMFSEVVKTFEPEIKRLKGLALGVLFSALRDAVVRAAPDNMTGKLAEIFDSVSQKMGADTCAEAPTQDHARGVHTGNGRRAETAGRDL
ncbi:MAG TPA: hypothetical protein VNX28_07540 [Gemmataceae bacterium]|jgi:hypothetical protein|nr:hypothetical protein [Gemmataceae bacterium]